MQIIGADGLVVCNAEFDVLKSGGILFDAQGILEIGYYEKLCAKHKGTRSVYFSSCALMPALANLHLHLGFSQNAGNLRFGDFGQWLDSVLLQRDALCKRGSWSV